MGIRWRLAGAFFLIIFALVGSVSVYLLKWSEDYYTRSVSEDLTRESKAIDRFISSGPDRVSATSIARAGRELGHRITVIQPDGTVVADSERDFRQMPNHSDRPEVRQAISTGFGTATRYSATLKVNMLYVATRADVRDARSPVVRVSEPLSGLEVVMGTIRHTFLLSGLIAVLLAAALSVKLATSITAPVENISTAARRLARGDLSARVWEPASPNDELGALAATFNNMAEQLENTIAQIDEQKARMQMVFDHADDGLVLLGPDGNIHMVNPAACGMLEIDCTLAAGKTVIEGTLNHDLASLVDRVIRTRQPSALDISVPAGDNVAVQAYVAPIDTAAGSSGTLAVLHDITESRRLDTIRRDFVANVSHELRTPLATIKAMAETILLHHASDPTAATSFAGRILEEADRMTLLAEDLLDLTRIETRGREIVVNPIGLRPLIDGVFASLGDAASRNSISLVCDIDPAGVVEAHAESLVQVIANLVDNAIKYTPSGGMVSVTAELGPGHVAIRVSDNGIGIPAENLPRIFERFYRVDKDRSRLSGGTGLGLAIVKHLCEQMGGSVSVESEVGVGTTFSVLLSVSTNNAGVENAT